METSETRPWGCAVALAVLLIASYQRPAEAIIINDAVGAAGALALGAPHLGVVNIAMNGSAWCTGSLIDDTHVLTAQHCTSGAFAGDFTVQFFGSDGTTLEGTRAVTGKAEMPGYTDTNFLAGLDVAILTIDSSAPNGFASFSLGLSDPTGAKATTVGFGFQGLGSVGYQGNAFNDYDNWLTYNYSYGTRWAAENTIDYFGTALGPNAAGHPGSANILSSDFDGPLGLNPLAGIGSLGTALGNEGTTCYGDSGGPLLVSGRIVGVLSGGMSPLNVCEEPDISWWTGVFDSDVRSFIASNSNAVFIPEPSAFVLALLGIAGLGVQRKLKRLQSPS